MGEKGNFIIFSCFSVSRSSIMDLKCRRLRERKPGADVRPLPNGVFTRTARFARRSLFGSRDPQDKLPGADELFEAAAITVIGKVIL